VQRWSHIGLCISPLVVFRFLWHAREGDSWGESSFLPPFIYWALGSELVPLMRMHAAGQPEPLLAPTVSIDL